MPNNTAASLTVAPTPAEDAYGRALGHLRKVQQDNGAFAGEVIWNPMLVSQYVIVCYVVGYEIPPKRRELIRLNFERQVRPDGGWGMHPDSPSWLFHTTLCYVVLRLLGYGAEDPLTAGALKWIREHGGVHALPAWGRIWLAVLGLYPWDGVQPIVPELWLLPDAAPMHPRRLYCHMRLIYLGLSYLYGTRYVAPRDETLSALRRELYPEGYDPKDFERYKDEVAATDLYEQPSPALQRVFDLVRTAEKFSPRSLRKKALSKALEHMLFEFRSTGYVCLSPVNGFLFCLALFVSDPKHPELEKGLAGMEYWVWEDEVDGTRFCGARSDIWDTSFVVQALCEGPHTPMAETIVRDACRWLPKAQIREEIIGGPSHYRELAYGGWGFANEYHPWPVSDCTAEALEALMRAEAAGLSDDAGRLPLSSKLAAVEFILLRQCDDGGFGSYEARRGPMLLKNYNPAEIYGNCMLEYSYTECSGSCVRGLAYALGELGEAVPADLRARTQTAIDRGAQFVLTQQRAEGGWCGFWGVNITYGTHFAIGGLLAGGTSRSHPAINKGCRWLVEAQRADGGWAESYEGMLHDEDIQLPEGERSLVVQTAWAILTLLEAAPHERDAIDRGIEYLISRQQDDGSWPQEKATGVFFNTAVLDYELYRQYFPAWALARYIQH
jgi:squalene/oxidosqualene cyclase-like protein